MKILDISLLGKSRRVADPHSLIGLIEQTIESEHADKMLVLTTHNMHSLSLEQSDNIFCQAQNSAKIGILDSTPLIWFLSLKGYEVNMYWRATMLDWVPLLLGHANTKKWNVFLLGSTPDAISSAATKLSDQFPNVAFKCHHGHFDLNSVDEITKVTDLIQSHNTDCLLVGMGMPRQEIWLSSIKDLNLAGAGLPVGGYFDYVAGKTFTPPRWTGKFGLEWLARLLADPKRLYHRYLIEPWPVLYKLVLELIRRKYP